ncbi:MAG: four-helix bundle copper-binding protein [Candidatus Aenigmarchaeota archaeon]|nr:four-helix bundle copper-binding protein [Candidatus Aenigmarchaeota archaeon]
MKRRSEKLEECIEGCMYCQRACLETLEYCLGRGGGHAELSHTTSLMDCAKLCEAAADLAIRGSALEPKVFELCAAACEKCADSCESFDDAQMKSCAETCRHCAGSCRRMARMIHA